MIQSTGKVISNRVVKPGYYLMAIDCPPVSRKAKPGQFLTIRCGGKTVPLLRRPFGFHRIGASIFEILYEIVGEGTRFLSGLKPADKLDILGPLGNGFPIPEKGKDFIIVAGGIGVAPLFALAEELARSPQPIAHRKPLILIGAKTKNGILCEREFRRLGCSVKVSTDDGSRGLKGAATDLLEDLPWTLDPGPWTIYACGPHAMLKAAARIAEKHRVECYASLEENIACGVGACLGCAIKTKSGYKLVCKDGPVFNVEEIIW